MTGLVIRTNGQAEEVKMDHVLLLLAQKVVGGYIEDVPLHGNMIMYVNEEGLRLSLPVNPLASGLAGTPIVGDVIVVGAADEDGEETGLTDQQLLQLRTVIGDSH